MGRYIKGFVKEEQRMKRLFLLLMTVVLFLSARLTCIVTAILELQMLLASLSYLVTAKLLESMQLRVKGSWLMVNTTT